MKLIRTFICLFAALTLLTGCASSGLSKYKQSSSRSDTAIASRLQKSGVQYITQGDKARLIFPADAFFDPSSARLNQDKFETLNNVTALLKRYQNSKFTITGYSDNVATDDVNKTISYHRAESFLAFFWSHGIDQDSFNTIGKGPENPVASNSTSLGSQMNRRIEITWDRSGA